MRRSRGVDGTDDGALLVRVAADAAAFEALYRRYVGRVTAFAVTRCASAADVGDVVAQTFVRLLRVGERYDPERGMPSAYVFAVAAGALRDHYRADRRQQALVHRAAGRDLLSSDEIERLESAIDAARLAPVVEDALESVAVGDGQVLRMMAAGASPSEAAREMGITPGAARLRLFRARRHVRSRLAATAGPETEES